jgi:hypothetical protein
LLRFDSLGKGFHTEIRGEARDSSNDGEATWIRLQIADERTVDFDLIEGEQSQIAQG